MLRAVLVVVLAVMLPSWTTFGQDNPHSRETLKGLPAVAVVVEELGESNKRAGFDARTFQTDVELKLRMAGIKVLSQEERSSTRGMPYLYLNVNAGASEPGGIVAYSMSLALVQNVLLDRDPSVLTSARTWDIGAVGQGDVQYVRNGVKDFVDRFINAWLSVNPKE